MPKVMNFRSQYLTNCATVAGIWDPDAGHRGAVAKILRHKIHHKPNPEGDTPVTVSTHESATYGSAISRTCIQCCARTFGLYYTPDLDPTSPRHIACLVPGLCPLRSSPVLIRSSGPRDRRESNPRLRSIWIQMPATVAQLVIYCDLKFIINRSRGFDSRRLRGPEDRMRTGEERKGQAPEQDKKYGAVKLDPSREYNIARTCVHSIECTYER